MPAWRRRAATARLAILQARDIFAVGCIGMNKAAVNRAFAAGFNDGRIKVPGVEAVRIRRISERTLFRWEAASAGGARGLGGAAAEKRGWSVIDDDPQLVNAILSILKDKPHIRLKHLYEALCASFPETKDGDRVTRPALPDRVSMRSLARWLEGFKARNRARWMQMLDPDKAKGHFQVAFGSRSIDVIRLNQRWETDATKFDVMCVDGRHAVVGVMDIYSRRARVRVCKRAASNAYDVGCTMRRGILDWGLPEQLISDNGADFTAAFIDLFCEALEIEHKTCAPYHGEEKPHIERFFGTIQHDVVELLPGFCGHSVAQAQTIRSRKTYQQRHGNEDLYIYNVKLTAEQLQTRLDEWMAVYEQTTHSELGMSPAAKAASWTQPARKIDDERKLDVLLAPVVRANKPPTVGKRGLTIDGGLYVDREAVLAEWVGKQVHVRRDPADLGRVWVFDGEGHFICVAENRERLGFSLAEVAAKGHERQKAMQKRWKQEERAADKEFHVDDIAELILEERRRNAAKVVELRPAPFPKPEISQTPAARGGAEVLASQAAALGAGARGGARARPAR